MDTKRKLVIVGSGPAAFTAAIYAARAELKPLVLAGEQSGGQLMLTTKVENYPGFADGVMGQDLMAAMRQQAEKHGVIIIDKNAIKLMKTNNGFNLTYGDPISENSENSDSQNIRLSDNQIVGNSGFPSIPSVLESNAVILATGASAITLKLPGEDRLMGRGVGTCAVCDAPFYRGKDTVFIIGGGDSAIEEASEISKFASKVIILVRKESLRATPIMRKSIKAHQNVEIWYKSQAVELLGDKKLERIKINKDGNIVEFSADGLFYAIGHKPATEWLAGSGVEVDDKGYIITPLSSIISENSENNYSGKLGKIGDPEGQIVREPEHRNIRLSDSPAFRHSGTQSIPSVPDLPFPTMTSISGIFAAGDCVDFRYRQAIVAAGFGAMAALDCQRWLES